MLLDLRRLFAGNEQRVSYDFAVDADDPEIPSPIAAHVRFRAKNKAVEMLYRAEFTVQTVCARCNAELSAHRKIEGSHLLTDALQDEDADDLIETDPAAFDAGELIREDVFLSLPSRFLCAEDCKGLCPTCGANLNEGQCACLRIADPRWAALAGFSTEEDG